MLSNHGYVYTKDKERFSIIENKSWENGLFFSISSFVSYSIFFIFYFYFFIIFSFFSFFLFPLFFFRLNVP